MANSTAKTSSPAAAAPKAKPAAAPAAGGMPPGASKALAGLLFFSLLMVTCPIGLYFLSYEGYFDGLYKWTVGIPQPDQRAVASAILAVVGVNIVVGGFVYMAFTEVNDDSKPKAAKPATAKKDD